MMVVVLMDLYCLVWCLFWVFNFGVLYNLLFFSVGICFCFMLFVDRSSLFFAALFCLIILCVGLRFGVYCWCCLLWIVWECCFEVLLVLFLPLCDLSFDYVVMISWCWFVFVCVLIVLLLCWFVWLWFVAFVCVLILVWVDCLYYNSGGLFGFIVVYYGWVVLSWLFLTCVCGLLGGIWVWLVVLEFVLWVR